MDADGATNRAALAFSGHAHLRAVGLRLHDFSHDRCFELAPGNSPCRLARGLRGRSSGAIGSTIAPRDRHRAVAPWVVDGLKRPQRLRLRLLCLRPTAAVAAGTTRLNRSAA